MRNIFNSCVSGSGQERKNQEQVGAAREIPHKSKFEQRVPSAQNAIEIFADHWACDLSGLVPDTHAGATKLFTDDGRPGFAMKAFAGDRAGRKLRVLELGPLEAAHTYQFEKMGVDEIVAVESNIEAFLKCLIVKNLLGLKNSKFLLGDLIEFLKVDSSRYDFIFCCGVLYQLQDPLTLIELMAARTDRIFIWTHCYSRKMHGRLPEIAVRYGDEAYVYHCFVYNDRNSAKFLGGNKPTASFMSREDLMRAFKQHGFVNFDLHDEDLNHPGGPCFSMSMWR